MKSHSGVASTTHAVFTRPQASMDVRMLPNFRKVPHRNQRQWLPNPRIVCRNSEDHHDEKGLRQDSCPVGQISDTEI